MTRRKGGFASLGITAALLVGAIVAIGQMQANGSTPASTRSPSAAAPSVNEVSIDDLPANAALVAAGLVDAQSRSLDAVAVLELLEQLDTSAEAEDAPYDRDAFGQRWADVDRNGCDTRNDLLRRDLVDLELKPGTRDCVVLSGRLADPYTGKSIAFEHGQGTSELVPIDHVVPLAWAWANGAADWMPEVREQFANDPINLQATTREMNTSKLDRGPAEWLPPAAGYQCIYIARFVLVASTYELALPAADNAAAMIVLDQCRTSTPDAANQEAG